MENQIREFISYLREARDASENTTSSYERDLKKLCNYLEDIQDVKKWEDVTLTHLNAYMLYLESGSYAASSISRSVASIRAFYHYLIREGIAETNPAEGLKPPKAEKKDPEILSVEQVTKLLSTPDIKTSKGVRDSAMLELLYATGIRVSELIGLKTDDLNMKLEYIVVRDRSKERVIPFGNAAKAALTRYLGTVRDSFVDGNDEGWLFTNVQGKPMSRQGFWKMLKNYASDSDIQADITPHTLRHSFAVHMIVGGADLNSIQKMMGHSDISTTQMYVNMNLDRMRNVYDQSHPRK